MGRVEGKVALVTGAALGIGRATCVMLAREGAAVAATDVLESEGAKLVEEIRARGGRAEFWRLDVSREDEVRRVFAGAVSAFGRLDVLVNNAGLGGASKPTDQISEEEWDRVMAVNELVIDGGYTAR